MDGIDAPRFPDEPQKISWFQSIYRFIQRRTKVVSVDTTYSVEADVFWVRCDATSAGFTVTLPTSADWGGRQIGFKKTDVSANVVTVSRAGSDKIDGSNTQTLTAQYQQMVVIADGSVNWDIIVKQ